MGSSPEFLLVTSGWPQVVSDSPLPVPLHNTNSVQTAAIAGLGWARVIGTASASLIHCPAGCTLLDSSRGWRESGQLLPSPTRRTD